MSVCDRPHYARGLCLSHYNRVKQHGDKADLISPISNKGYAAGICRVPGCDRISSKRGYCAAHYIRWRKGTDVSSPIRHPGTGRMEWIVQACKDCLDKGSLCRTHNNQLRRHKITAERLSDLLLNGCGVCGRELDVTGKPLRIDHDHNCPNGCGAYSGCGQCVRGVLCSLHNQLAGFLEHPDRFAVLKYLNEWKGSGLVELEESVA